MSGGEQRGLLRRLARALSQEGVAYMVIGGQAVLVHGEPRLTRDVDVTVGLAPEELATVERVCSRAGLRVLVEDPEGFVQQTWVLPAADPVTGLRVDFVFAASPYEAEAMERAVSVPLGDVSLRVASAEDLVVHKLVAGRPRDLEDVLGVLRRNPGLDVEQVRRWLREMEQVLEEPLERRLEDVLAQLAQE